MHFPQVGKSQRTHESRAFHAGGTIVKPQDLLSTQIHSCGFFQEIQLDATGATLNQVELRMEDEQLHTISAVTKQEPSSHVGVWQ